MVRSMAAPPPLRLSRCSNPSSTGINSGDLDSLMPLYESEAAFAG